MHRFVYVRRWHFEDRFGESGVTPQEGKVIELNGEPYFLIGPSACLACMLCGYLRDWLPVPPGTELPAPVWIPPRYRHKPTCPLCLNQSVDRTFARCEACGATSEMLARAGLR